AREQFKGNPQAIAAFADFYVRDKRPAEAEKLLRDFLATPAGKGNADITLKLTDLLDAQGKIDEALAVAGTGPEEFPLQVRKIDLLITQNKLSDAESQIKALQGKKNTPELNASLAYVYLNSNRAKDAVQLLDQVIVENPGMTTAYYFRAMAKLKVPGANP